MGEVATAVSQVSAMSEVVLDDPIIGTVIKIGLAGIIFGLLASFFFRNR